MGKFGNRSVEDGRLVWGLDDEALQTEALFDGCYVVYTDLPVERMSKEEAVASYKKLSLVEEAFRNLKTVWLQVRPVYHKTDDRIRTHVFICMLAYYLQWHMQRRLVPLFESDGRGKGRKWSFSSVMASLRQITINPVRLGKVQFQQLTVPTVDQQKLLDLIWCEALSDVAILVKSKTAVTCCGQALALKLKMEWGNW
jgi:hypothetical protein